MTSEMSLSTTDEVCLQVTCTIAAFRLALTLTGGSPYHPLLFKVDPGCRNIGLLK
jgi:hypothetical protein